MRAVSKHFAKEWELIEAGRSKVGWLRFHRACDETPKNLAFGGLIESLQPIARYWVTESDGGAAKDAKQRLVTFEEFKKYKLGRKKLKSGVLEVMAQTCFVTIAKEILHPIDWRSVHTS